MTSLLFLETIVNSFLVPVCVDHIQLEADTLELFEILLGPQAAIL